MVAAVAAVAAVLPFLMSCYLLGRQLSTALALAALGPQLAAGQVVLAARHGSTPTPIRFQLRLHLALLQMVVAHQIAAVAAARQQSAQFYEMVAVSAEVSVAVVHQPQRKHQMALLVALALLTPMLMLALAVAVARLPLVLRQVQLSVQRVALVQVVQQAERLEHLAVAMVVPALTAQAVVVVAVTAAH
jgi:hypothetical protein